MSSVIPLDENGGSGEKNAQVEILIQHLLKALRGVYKKTGIVDNPVDARSEILVASAIFLSFIWNDYIMSKLNMSQFYLENWL